MTTRLIASALIAAFTLTATVVPIAQAKPIKIGQPVIQQPIKIGKPKLLAPIKLGQGNKKLPPIKLPPNNPPPVNPGTDDAALAFGAAAGLFLGAVAASQASQGQVVYVDDEDCQMVKVKTKSGKKKWVEICE